jgi:hypothetical protein
MPTESAAAIPSAQQSALPVKQGRDQHLHAAQLRPSAQQSALPVKQCRSERGVAQAPPLPLSLVMVPVLFHYTCLPKYLTGVCHPKSVCRDYRYIIKFLFPLGRPDTLHKL